MASSEAKSDPGTLRVTQAEGAQSHHLLVQCSPPQQATWEVSARHWLPGDNLLAQLILRGGSHVDQDASLCACCLGPTCQTPWVAQSEEPQPLPEAAVGSKIDQSLRHVVHEAGV